MRVKLWRALPQDQWPVADQQAFARACAFWKSASWIKAARIAFGQLLAYCTHTACPLERDSVARFQALVQARLTPEAARTTLRGLADALLALRPTAGEGWAWLLEANRMLLRTIRRTGTKPRPRPTRTLSVAFEDWPAVYQQRWARGRTPPAAPAGAADRYDLAAARAAAAAFEGGRSRLYPWEWGRASEKKARRGWGMWLWWVAQHDAAHDPDGITPERVARYIDWCARRPSPRGSGKRIASGSCSVEKLMPGH